MDDIELQPTTVPKKIVRRESVSAEQVGANTVSYVTGGSKRWKAVLFSRVASVRYIRELKLRTFLLRTAHHVHVRFAWTYVPVSYTVCDGTRIDTPVMQPQKPPELKKVPKSEAESARIHELLRENM